MPRPTQPATARWRGVALGTLTATLVLLVREAREGSLAALGAFAMAAVAAGFLRRRSIERFGPRHLLPVLLPIEAVGAAVLALVPLLDLGPVVVAVDAALLGAAAAVHVKAERSLARHAGRPAIGAGISSLVLGAGAVWFVNVGVAGSLLGAVLLLAATAVARMPDPLRAGPTPLSGFLPWRAPDGTPLPAPAARWWARSPATMTYLVVTTFAYAAFVSKYRGDVARAPAGFVRFFVYQIPDLVDRPALVLLHLFTSVWINWHIVQLVYVIVLLVAVGLRFEAREGSLRAILVFYGASIVAGLAAGGLLVALRPWIDAPWVDRAWDEVWIGGSAGAFGLIGATAARARRPAFLLALAALWELNVALFFLKSYTPAFHLTALATGYLVARHALPPRTSPERRL